MGSGRELHARCAASSTIVPGGESGVMEGPLGRIVRVAARGVGVGSGLVSGVFLWSFGGSGCILKRY